MNYCIDPGWEFADTMIYRRPISALCTVLMMVASCSSKRAVGPQCSEMGESVYAAELVRKFGQPDKKQAGAPPLEWWAYEGNDGTCLVAVYGDVVHPKTDFIARP